MPSVQRKALGAPAVSMVLPADSALRPPHNRAATCHMAIPSDAHSLRQFEHGLQKEDANGIPPVERTARWSQLVLSRTGWSSPFVTITFALGDVASALRASMYS